MGLTLGAEPQPLTVRLSTGADFACTLEAKDGATALPWPAGTVVELIFATTTPTTWTATISTNLASWSVQQAVADLIPTGTAVALWHRLTGVDTLWALGQVYRS